MSTAAVKREWRRRNPEKVRATKRRSYRLHKDAIRARAKEKRVSAVEVERVLLWRERNPDRARELKRKAQASRRARLRGAWVEHVDPRVLFERDEGVCGICGKPCDRSDYEIDHIVPLSRGGEHSYRNTQVAHTSCNRRKSHGV